MTTLEMELVQVKKQNKELENRLAQVETENIALENELQYAKKRIAALEEQIQKQRLEEARKNGLLKIHEYIFSNLGLSSDKIKKFDDKIIAYKENYQVELHSNDMNIQESAIANMQDMVAKLADQLVCGNVGDNVERCKNNLENSFGDVWNILDEDSKTFLITAKVMFESMIRNDKYDTLDYSGVCLLVTKALELESYKVFFKEYIQYLKENKMELNQYPKALLIDSQNHSKLIIKLNYNFTLGAVIHILGLHYNQRTKIINIARNSEADYHTFLKYAEEKLYNCTETQIEKEIRKNAIFIERTKLDYRNPSAHTGRLTKIVCTECLEYIVDTEKEMKRMLENMKKRNKK